MEIRKYGTLVVIESMSGGRHGARVLCRCDCGNLKVAYTHELKAGRLKSCGCLKKKHGCAEIGKRTKEYRVWVGMKQRCNNPNSKSYARYGGRGIRVCKEWEDFRVFYADMGKCPDGWSIERIDNDGMYSPDNCKWASASEQQINKRNTIMYGIDGKNQALSQWASEMGMRTSTLSAMLKYRDLATLYEKYAGGKYKVVPKKLTPVEAMAVFKSNAPYADIAREYGISKSSVCNIKAKRVWGRIHGPN